jgi:hypothetical protein
VCISRPCCTPDLGSRRRSLMLVVIGSRAGYRGPTQGRAHTPGNDRGRSGPRMRAGEMGSARTFSPPPTIEIRPVPERHFHRSYRRFVRRVWAERRPCHQLFTLRIGCHATLVASGASVRSWNATGLVTPAASAGRVVTPARMNTASTPSVPKPIWRIEVSCFAILVAI